MVRGKLKPILGKNKHLRLVFIKNNAQPNQCPNSKGKARSIVIQFAKLIATIQNFEPDKILKSYIRSTEIANSDLPKHHTTDSGPPRYY